jgi:tetratricopeptide (TPR) repeat protein
MTQLREALAACSEAMEERTRERDPQGWAATQDSLGFTLEALGERESGTARLEEAVTADRAALEERTRERDPLQWAETQSNLGAALEALGERQKDAKLMEEAVKAMSGAAETYQQAGEGYWLPIAQKRVTEMQAELAELKR